MKAEVKLKTYKNFLTDGIFNIEGSGLQNTNWWFVISETNLYKLEIQLFW